MLLAVLLGLTSAAMAQSPYPDRIEPWTGILRAVVGDVDEDGVDDLVAIAHFNSDERLFVLLSQGDGSWTPVTLGHLLPPGTTVWAEAELADMDGDGHLDIVTLVNSQLNPPNDMNWVCTLRGDGNGGFTSHENLPMSLATHELIALAVGRLDADADADVALAIENDAAIEILFNDGAGHLGATGATVPLPFQPWAVEIARLNADDRGDLLAHGLSSPTVAVLLNSGTGNTYTTSTLSFAGVVKQLRVADFGVDGRADLAVLHQSQSPSPYAAHVTVQMNTGSGGFFGPTIWSIPSDTGATLQTGFLNGDAFVDLAVTSTALNEVHLKSFLNAAGAGFTVAYDQPLLGYSLLAPPHDFDDDGDGDLVLMSDLGLLPLRGDGSGAFAPVDDHIDVGPSGTSSSRLVHPDLDGDGWDDLVLRGWPTGFSIRWGGPSAPFTTGSSRPPRSPIRQGA